MSEYSPGRYEGRVAIVTGGASGIGEAIVRRLAREGASVVAADVNTERLDQVAVALRDTVVGQPCDVRCEGDVAALVDVAVRRFGRLDTAFNVAGAARNAPIVDLSEDDWNLAVDICLKGVYLCMKHQARQMLAQDGGGAIVNISSLNSRVPKRGGAAYCAAKAGVAMLSECGALEWGEAGIRVNTISPGVTATPLMAAKLELPHVVGAFLERIPLKEVGKPEHMAAAALYLASDDAAYISGVNLFVDGGWATTTYPDFRPVLAPRRSHSA